MLQAQIPGIIPAEFSRCEERSQEAERGKSLSSIQKTDAAIKETVERAIWNDDVLRAIEYYEIAVHVNNGVVYLSGHIVGTTSRSRLEKAVRAIPGIRGIKNNLVLDDKLTLEVAASLGTLEHTYSCKFFTGASHGVISLNGIVSAENVKLLAEKCVAGNPNVRAVINNIRVSGSEMELPAQPFLQPTIGEIIYFLDGISGVVKQVIINPNNRCVVAMTVWGQFADQRQDLKSLNSAKARSPERLVVLSMDLIRYMTRVSGFLTINSHDRTRYMDFDLNRFSTPKSDWKAPYPYCPDDVLFPVEKQQVKFQVLEQLPRPPLVVAPEEQLLWEQLLANDSLGG
ncbi:MAG TPA: BON domain-containing protein [Anaerolineales bacterium]|nr:BON domain-containing protein [Anaerolineales bacterium]